MRSWHAGWSRKRYLVGRIHKKYRVRRAHGQFYITTDIFLVKMQEIIEIESPSCVYLNQNSCMLKQKHETKEHLLCLLGQ